MHNQGTAWLARPVTPSSKASSVPTRLANALLGLASGVLLALACASAWLSYHAQVAYVLAHNGNLREEARVWALLLDAGTAGVSLLRLYETLLRRSGLATRISLLGCIAASVTMNLLHAPSRSAGGYLVAAVPPVMYAVFLEHLLTNLRGLLMADRERRSFGRTLALWVNFPGLMWRGWRNALRRDAEGASAPPEAGAHADHDERRVASDVGGAAGQVAHTTVAANASGAESAAYCSRRARGLGPKRVAFEEALTAQVRGGDLRLFSDDERERNAAAYQAAASLPVPLSPGTARRYVVQALARFGGPGAQDTLPVLEAAAPDAV